VAVRSWTDGRAWVAVRSTGSWPGGRLFGVDSDVVRPVALGAGVAYLVEGGTAVAVHAADVDAVVVGSVPTGDLLRVAASLGVGGTRVPRTWAEASSTTVAHARGVIPGLLVPRRIRGFAPPSVRLTGENATMAYAGAGARGFLVVESPGTGLAPPLERDVRGVTVRGRTGRYVASAGQLEWVEGGVVVELRSSTLALDELLSIATAMGPAR
jgi:hypothetical protein